MRRRNIARMNKNVLKKLIFVVLYLFSMFSMHSDRLGLYWGNNGTPFMFFRFFLIIIMMALATLINSDNLEFISRFVPRSTLLVTALIIFDYYVTNFSGGQFLYRVWWIAYAMVTLMTVFITVTLNADGDYGKFYKSFWRCFTPLYFFVFCICFIRMPGEAYTMNMQIGQGTFLMLKAFVQNLHISFEAPLMVFGNLVIFTPLPFILSAWAKKLKPPWILLIGFLTPFAVEGYQFIFKCGNVDIDDIILNFSGFLIAFIIYIINKKCKKV